MGNDAVERVLLRHVTDVVTPPLRRPAVDLHMAARQAGQTEQHAQQRRLARAVRAEHRDELARRDVEIEMLEQRARAEPHRRVAQLDDDRSALSSACPTP